MPARRCARAASCWREKSTRSCDQLNGQARILCVGCGHLREADLARSASAPTLDDRFHGRQDLCHFDLIYSPSLYEVLDEQDARDLTRNLFANLLPGGRLLMGNFLPGVPNVAYLEGLLDWHRHYRNAAVLLDLLLGIPYNDIGSARVFHDPGHCVASLEVTRYG